MSIKTANRTLAKSRTLLNEHGINSDRVLTALGTRRHSICTEVNMWIVPSGSSAADEAAHYRDLMKEAEQTKYIVRRVEFSGNTNIRDRTLRRGFLQREGDVFSEKLLEKSLTNFHRIAPVYPVTFKDVEVSLDPAEKLMDFTIYFRERPTARRHAQIQ